MKTIRNAITKNSKCTHLFDNREWFTNNRTELPLIKKELAGVFDHNRKMRDWE